MEILPEISSSYDLSGFNTSLLPYLSIFLIKKKGYHSPLTSASFTCCLSLHLYAKFCKMITQRYELIIFVRT